VKKYKETSIIHNMEQSVSNIYKPDESFPFDKIQLTRPMSIKGGAHLTKVVNLDGNDIYIQTPKCNTKQGFIKSGRRIYNELSFDKINFELIEWFEKLEEKLQELIFEKKSLWFDDDELSLEDIEFAFKSSLKPYKAGNYYNIRCYTDSPRMLQTSALQIFDQNENILTMDEVNNNSDYICILHLYGITFTQKTFQVYFQLKQMMVLNNNQFEKCQITFNKVNEKKEDSLEENNNITLSVENSIQKEEKEEQIEEDNEYSSDDEDDDISNDGIEKLSLGNEDIDINDLILTDIETKEDDDKIVTEKQDASYLEESNLVESKEEDVDNIEQVKSDNENKKHLEILEGTMEEYNIDQNEIKDEPVSIKNRNDIYYNLYQKAIKKAKQARLDAINSFLEAKNIKESYLLDVDDEIYDDFKDIFKKIESSKMDEELPQSLEE
jgi:hypothetical protein